MELGSWYMILGVALIFIAFGVRFIAYRVLVGQSRWLPEKAGKMANMLCGITAGAGVLLIVGNYLTAHH